MFRSYCSNRLSEPISSTSRKPSVVTNRVSAPRRSITALVASVVPWMMRPISANPIPAALQAAATPSSTARAGSAPVVSSLAEWKRPSPCSRAISVKVPPDIDAHAPSARIRRAAAWPAVLLHEALILRMEWGRNRLGVRGPARRNAPCAPIWTVCAPPATCMSSSVRSIRSTNWRRSRRHSRSGMTAPSCSRMCAARRCPAVSNVYGSRRRLCALIEAPDLAFCPAWNRLTARAPGACGIAGGARRPPPDRALRPAAAGLFRKGRGTVHHRGYPARATIPETGVPNLSFHRAMHVSDSELRNPDRRQPRPDPGTSRRRRRVARRWRRPC